MGSEMCIRDRVYITGSDIPTHRCQQYGYRTTTATDFARTPLSTRQTKQCSTEQFGVLTRWVDGSWHRQFPRTEATDYEPRRGRFGAGSGKASAPCVDHPNPHCRGILKTFIRTALRRRTGISAPLGGVTAPRSVAVLLQKRFSTPPRSAEGPALAMGL